MSANADEHKNKVSVFISYAREDRDFVQKLSDALAKKGIQPVGDWLLTTGEKYLARLRDLNLGANAFIFVISPDSTKSEACKSELALAVDHKKQILPISRRDHGDDSSLDPSLRTPHWTFLRETDDFDAGINNLVLAINTDFALMEMHSRLLTAADNWAMRGRNRSYLLRKDGLKAAETWLTDTAVQRHKLPQPTALQVEYILASRTARSRGTRIAFAIALTVALALSLLSIVALIQRSRAFRNAEEATRQQAAAEENARRANAVAERRLVISTLLINPEETSFSTLLKNPDGAGLSFGLAAWDQRRGNLGRFLRAFQAEDPQAFALTFADGNQELAARLIKITLGKNGGVNQAGEATEPEFNLIAEPWLSRFKRAGEDPKLQKIQLKIFTDEYLKFMEELRQFAPEIQSERGVAFMLDLAFQHGTMNARKIFDSVRQPGLKEMELLRLMQDESARRSPRFSEAIYRRRQSFITSPFLSDTVLGFQ